MQSQGLLRNFWFRRGRRLAAVAVLVAAAAPAAHADLVGTLQKDLQNIEARMAADAQNIQRQLQAAVAGWEAGAAKAAAGWSAAMQKLLANLGGGLNQAGGAYLAPTPGTASFQGYIQYQGLARRYLVIRPEPATLQAPALILMHPHGGTPETMGNIARAGRLAAQYGAWVFLPEGEGRQWNDDPASMNPVDDVGFISRLIDTAVSSYGIDPKRVYAAGYSGGGFMAQRLACQLSTKIVGFVADAATLRKSLMAACAPAHAMPAAFMNGTADLIVPYNGEPGLESAAATLAFWGAAGGCAPGQMQTSALPQQVGDGTTVALTRYGGCAAGAAAELYTIGGGGHTWPGSSLGFYTTEFGRTTQNLDATIAAWKFLAPYSLP